MSKYKETIKIPLTNTTKFHKADLFPQISDSKNLFREHQQFITLQNSSDRNSFHRF